MLFDRTSKSNTVMRVTTDAIYHFLLDFNQETSYRRSKPKKAEKDREP